MPQNKRIIFDPNQQEMAGYALALSHPARLAIINWLKNNGFTLCHEMAELLPLSRPTVSHHLAALLKAQIIQRTVMAGLVGYELNQQGWHAARLSLKSFKVCLPRLKRLNH